MKARSFLLVAFTACVGVFYALPVLAEEEERAKAGLPQLDVSLFPEQLFWLAISFTLLYCLMKFVALPGVESTQAKRKNIIDTELHTARAANDLARSMGAKADKALADARAKAQTTISDIKVAAMQHATEQQAAQSKQLHDRLREAEARIAATRDAALRDIDGGVSELVAAIVDNVSGLKVKA